VHLKIAISGVAGEFPDPDPMKCGPAIVLRNVPGCGLDTMRFCGSAAPLVATLTDAQVVPPSGSGEMGTCSGSVSSSQTALGITCSHNVANPTEAHFHLGPPGTNGTMLTPLTVGPSSAGGTLPMTPSLLHELQEGNLYVCISSSAFPSGSVRGQLRAEIALNFPLEGGQVVPPSGSAAVGQCAGALNASRTLLALGCTHDVASPTDANLRVAPRGMTGSSVFDFGNGASPIVGAVPIPGAVSLQALLDGNLYVDVSSTPFPNGEIRGQIDPPYDHD
jgi:hypothetical protein